MKIDAYEFKYICDIEPQRNPDGSIREFMPQDRYKNSRNLALNPYGAGPFCKFKIPRTFPVSGVYALTVHGEVRYIGECANLTARFNAGYGNISPKNCFEGGQQTNCRLNNLVYRAVRAEQRMSLWFVQTTDYKSLELIIRIKLKPPWNRV